MKILNTKVIIDIVDLRSLPPHVCKTGNRNTDVHFYLYFNDILHCTTLYIYPMAYEI